MPTVNLSNITIYKPENLSSACVFSSPHSGRNYSEAFIKSTKLDYMTLRSSEDFYLDNIFENTLRTGTSFIKANFPRAFLDLNREPFELDPDMFTDKLPSFVNSTSKKVALGLGTVPKVVSIGTEIYSKKLLWKEAEKRIENYYFPYHMHLKQLLIKNKSKFGLAIVIDCHSMPSNTQTSLGSKHVQIPDIILGDNFGKSCDSRITNFIKSFFLNRGYSVRRNNPYSGGFITQNYGRPKNNFHAIQIEINRSLYMDEHSIQLNDGYILLKNTIKILIDELNNLNNINFFNEQSLQNAAE